MDEVADFALMPDGALVNMKDMCTLCAKPVDKDDSTTWKLVQGYVGGPKKDSMRLRKDTGHYAHDSCIKKLSEGQAPDQESMFDAPLRTMGQLIDDSREYPDVFSD